MSHLMTRRHYLGALAGLGLITTGGPSTFAAPVRPPSLEWWIPYSGGGTTDALVRDIVPAVMRHLAPGTEPLLRNKVGGGGLRTAKAFARRMGTKRQIVLATSAEMHISHLVGEVRADIDPTLWAALAAIPGGGVVYAPKVLKLPSAADFRQVTGAKLRFGMVPKPSLDFVAAMALQILGIELDLYPVRSRRDTRVVMDDAAITLDYQITPTYLKWIAPKAAAGEVVPLFSFGLLDADGNIIRDPHFPDLPSFPEFYATAYGAPPTGPLWEKYKLFFLAGFACQRFFVMHGVKPEGTIADFRDAFDAALNDPKFLERFLAPRARYRPLTGAPVTAAWEKIAGTTAAGTTTFDRF
ncbi:MAG: hypothetical protein ACPGO3_10240 [Magnetospiraceae bacterium]